jgi:hypothetical protein
MASVTVKQGDTLEWIIAVTSNDVVLDLTGYAVRAQIRRSDVLVASLTVTFTNPSAGIMNLTATAAQTDAWPAGTHKCDIEFTDLTGDVFSSDTFDVIVLEDISHD